VLTVLTNPFAVVRTNGESQLDQAKKDIQKLAKKLAVVEAELAIWRSGGTVSEAQRANLSANPELLASLTGEAEGESSAGGISAEDAAIFEREREELLQRETELLELLDEKVWNYGAVALCGA
jgi:hypothetical protein